MGKAGRFACILTPWALTVASFVCLILIELGGFSSNSTELNNLYFFKANFTGLNVSAADSLENTTTLTVALEEAKNSGKLASLYEIHLWNYCSANGSANGTIDYCSGRHSNYYFDPVEVWGLNATNQTASSTVSGSNPVSSAVNTAENNTEALENQVLGKSGQEALDAYEHIAKWMFIAYEVSFWTTLATIICSILALFSRIGSFFTWLFSIVSSFFTFAAVITSTILFGALVGALEGLLHPYGVKVTLGGHALAIAWLAVAFSWAATLFWLFSVCCCSGRDNPHHRSNKGGLWAAEPKGQGYGGGGMGRGRGLRVEKTGGGYERVGSPFIGGGEHGDHVPLNPYPQQTGHYRGESSGGFEPFRHQR